MSVATDENKMIRVLMTGFGPFSHYGLNPSWMAVRELHNLTLSPPGKPRVHITCRKVKVTYAEVLQVVPDMHARPPVLLSGAIEDEDRGAYILEDSLPIPETGYDLIIHVGVGRKGNMRIEQIGHKTGYGDPDVDGQYAPVVKQEATGEATAMSHLIEKLGLGRKKEERGFGEGYEELGEELSTSIDVLKLVSKLHETGLTKVSASTEAGRYLCEFIFYCSLAMVAKTGSTRNVLFVHCPPVEEGALGTNYAINTLKEIVLNCV